MSNKSLSRREFLKLSSGTAALALLPVALRPRTKSYAHSSNNTGYGNGAYSSNVYVGNTESAYQTFLPVIIKE